MKDLIILEAIIFFGWLIVHFSKKNNQIPKAKPQSEKSEPETEEERKHKEAMAQAVINDIDEKLGISMIFKIVGVSFSDNGVKRQDTLKKFYYKEPPFDGDIDFDFEPYEFNRKAALKIYANGLLLGTAPADKVDSLIENLEQYDYDLEYTLYGSEDKMFGCALKFIWRK